ncbi:TPA_exp: hypothetical protein A8136_2555 [Trichophyton benhamiae CBS 112371]|nr:TPA_exp: hypothetical protein A8136_2555 [Trichophyton benhamiae CBS 112371]
MVSLKLATILLIPSAIAGVIKRQDDAEVLAFTGPRCDGTPDHPVPLDTCEERFIEDKVTNSIDIAGGIICTVYGVSGCNEPQARIPGPRCLRFIDSTYSYQCMPS